MVDKLRVYQAWKGNNIFVCGGRLIFGPDARSLVATVLLILTPVIIFCTLVGKNLVDEFQVYGTGYAMMVFVFLFTIAVLVLLFLTSARDPGIVPRNPRPPEEEMCYDSSASTEGIGRTPTPRLPRTKEVIINNIPVRVKYCDTCMLYRPPRCSHCSVCNNCVDRFDHHCPWVGQCIGVRNYRYFFLFISSTALLCMFIFAMSALYLKYLFDDYGNMWKAMKKSPAAVVLIAFCFLALWFVGGLTGFHIYLISTNQTTYENFRYKADNRRRAFDRGCFNNFRQVLCGKIEPSRNNFRAHVQDEVLKTTRGPARPGDMSTLFGDRREKVEDDLDIGGNLSKLSHRRDAEDGEGIQG